MIQFTVHSIRPDAVSKSAVPVITADAASQVNMPSMIGYPYAMSCFSCMFIDNGVVFAFMCMLHLHGTWNVRKHTYINRFQNEIRVRSSPERDILSLRTLGLGLARFGRSSAGAFPAIFWQKRRFLKSEISEKKILFARTT